MSLVRRAKMKSKEKGETKEREWRRENGERKGEGGGAESQKG